MIEVVNLTKKFGSFPALSDISFSVKKGQIVGFLGPNGAGKTTTMRIITGYLSSTKGSVMVNNYNVDKSPEIIKNLIGYLPEDNPLYYEMKVYEYLFFLGNIRNLGKNLNRNFVKVICDCQLKEVATQEISKLSKGYRQRVGLASALLHDPEILILDEPTNGLDPNQIAEIRSLIKKLSKKKTILLSTHILAEVEAIAQKAVIINKGKIVYEGKVSDLAKTQKGKNVLNVKIKGRKTEIMDKLKKIKGVLSITGEEEKTLVNFEVETMSGVDIREDIFLTVKKNNWILLEQTPKVISLEEIFQQLTLKD